MMLDAAGREDEALAVMKSIYKPSQPQPEIALGYARILARAGKRDEALQLLSTSAATTPINPPLQDLIGDDQGRADAGADRRNDRERESARRSSVSAAPS